MSSSSSDTDTLTAFAREDLIKQVEALMTERDLSMRKACLELGVDIATVSRWRKEYMLGGREALRPRYKNCGRPEKFPLGEEEAKALRFLRLETGSLPLAVENFVNHPQCSPATRALIVEELNLAAEKGRIAMWPQSLQRAARVTAEEENAFRGRKHIQETEMVDRRGMWWTDERGLRHEMQPNDIFESDDMSLNEPFRYVDPEAREEQVGRQTLCSIDVFSAHWLGVSPIGRERQAYRVEDIADHIADVIAQHGLPRIWRFERGVWENTFIDGIELEDGTRWGGLDGLCNVVHVFKSRGKGTIESSFNLLQDLTAHQSTTIGRSRSEFELATKHFLRAQNGNTASLAKFWTIYEAADAIGAAMERFNLRPKVRRAFGRMAVVPADLYRHAVRRAVPADQAWRLLPVKKAATVRQGCIECVVPHYPLSFRFRVNGTDGLYLEHGYRVMIAFHPGKPEQGCFVFNGETGAKNREGYRHGELILIAPMAEDAPQIAFDRDDKRMLARKKASAAIHAEFRGIVAAGARQRRVSTLRDGYGDASTVEVGARKPEAGNETPQIGSRRPQRITPQIDMTDLRRREAAMRGEEHEEIFAGDTGD